MSRGKKSHDLVEGTQQMRSDILILKSPGLCILTGQVHSSSSRGGVLVRRKGMILLHRVVGRSKAVIYRKVPGEGIHLRGKIVT